MLQFSFGCVTQVAKEGTSLAVTRKTSQVVVAADSRARVKSTFAGKSYATYFDYTRK